MDRRERGRKGKEGRERERKGEKGRGRVLPIGNHRRGARNHLIMPGKILIFTN
jgi:hypothetical protein